MPNSTRNPPGTIKHISSEERWKQYRSDGGFGGQSGGVQDEETKAKEGGRNPKQGPLGVKAKVGAAGDAGRATGHTPSMGSTPAGPIASAPATVLPHDEATQAPQALQDAAFDAAGTLPITNRAATVDGSAELTRSATPLSRAVDKLSDDLAQGVTDVDTLKKDVADYQSAMQDAGHGDEVALGLKIMIEGAQLSDTAAITAVAKNAGIDLSEPTLVTAAQAQQKLQEDLADSSTDAGIIDLDVQQIKNVANAQADDTTAEQLIDEAVGSTGESSNTAALFAAAAKNGVDLSQDSTDKADGAKNKAAVKSADKAMQKQAAEQGAKQAAQEQASHAGGGGGGGSGGGGGGSGNTSTNVSSQAPTYDPAAAASPYGAKENLSNWTQQVYPAGMFNNEQEHYTNNGQNISYGADGSATITARNEGDGHWSSARITGDPVGTLPKYLEATIANPSGQGTWPAFWLVGPGSWPQGGEIDVMEQINGEPTLHTSNHWGASGVDSAGAMPPWSPTESFSGIDMTQPHRYGVLVTDSGVQFYLDGKKIGKPVTYPPEANFPKIASEMVPTINLAIGGSWPGNAPNNLGDQTMRILSMTRSTTPPED